MQDKAPQMSIKIYRTDTTKLQEHVHGLRHKKYLQLCTRHLEHGHACRLRILIT
jgi:hypothetical protein